MIERIVEDWLNRVNERSFEIPFCQLLNTEGHQVIHLSRHGPFEEGKDILSINPDGTACAFQLKSGTITLKTWEQYIAQVVRLVEIPINHPSVSDGMNRRVFLVVTGELDEEVRLEIIHRNQDWERRGLPKLETIVAGQLLRRFLEVSTNFWPSELQSVKILLELYLVNGRACLDKGKLSEFILSLIPIYSENPTKAECERALASASIFTSYVLSPYVDMKNHVAIIEGWSVYIACLVGLVEKHTLDKLYWKNTLDIAVKGIEQAFSDLYEELQSRNYMIEGNALVDAPFYQGRLTWLVGLISTYELWKQLHDRSIPIDLWAKDFVFKHRREMLLWGEGAIPQILAMIWLLRRVLNTKESDELLSQLIDQISHLNNDDNFRGLPDPYQSFETVISENNGLSQETSSYVYRGMSYTLECLVHLYARQNWRQKMRHLWRQVTYITFAEYEPDLAWQFCLWRSTDYGRLIEKQPNLTQSWSELREAANEVDTSRIPKVFVERPELLLLFIIVYPHRLTANVGKLLDNSLSAR